MAGKEDSSSIIRLEAYPVYSQTKPEKYANADSHHKQTFFKDKTTLEVLAVCNSFVGTATSRLKTNAFTRNKQGVTLPPKCERIYSRSLKIFSFVVE
ncbi:hypothetical protein Y032_0620g737 [Ancylostoma ceylanicum]|uniref:Uncharacterized protein n=1 Tax=Ancylostoma ceylanicum TaxID=53326 RepID=A0A016WL15_9BILA|nr:hypothetical protein Y032_0620g737 [Ancylostoma ceylanicum]